MSKIVITGGLGYIGMELSKIYSGKSRNNEIIVIDNNFYSQRVSQLKRWNISFYQKDILDIESCKDIFKNADIIFSNANRFMMSHDAGKTWEIMRTPHGDNHDIWINPNNTKIWIQSNDGGANITFNGGKSWTTQFNQPTAEIYQVEVDNQYPYWLYGGQQDNSTTISVPSLPPYPMQAGPNAWIMQTGGCETGPAVPNPVNPNIVSLHLFSKI